jgi:regulatory protein
MVENALYKVALNKAMAICSRREICIKDIQDKLESWGIGKNESEKITALLIKENFLNEERFAQAFVKDKFNYNKCGKVKISAHLRAKNIPGEIINNALDVIDNDLYIRTLRDLISRHRKSVKAKNQYDLKGKLLRYGSSKGFESSLIYDILNDIED